MRLYFLEMACLCDFVGRFKKEQDSRLYQIESLSLVAGVTETFPHDLKRRSSPKWTASLVAGVTETFPHDLKRRSSPKWTASLVAGVGLEPHDLRVMSPTSYHLLHPAISAFQPLYVITLRQFCQGRMGSNQRNLNLFGYYGQNVSKTD